MNILGGCSKSCEWYSFDYRSALIKKAVIMKIVYLLKDLCSRYCIFKRFPAFSHLRDFGLFLFGL